MTTKNLFVLIFIGVLAISFSSCSHNPKPEPVQDGFHLKTISKTAFPVTNVPAWLIYIPEGDYAIGIATENTRKPNLVVSAAKEFAASSFSLYHSSYIVDKSAVIRYAEQKETSLRKEGFEVTLNKDASDKNYADKNISSYAETVFQGYKLFLFGKQKPEVNNDIIQTSAASTPEWCKWKDVAEDNEYIYSIGYAHEANLADSWKNAQEAGLRKLAQFKLLNSVASLNSTDDTTKKMQIIETATKSPEASISKIWFFQKIVDDESGYSVFLMLKSKKTQ